MTAPNYFQSVSAKFIIAASLMTLLGEINFSIIFTQCKHNRILLQSGSPRGGGGGNWGVLPWAPLCLWTSIYSNRTVTTYISPWAAQALSAALIAIIDNTRFIWISNSLNNARNIFLTTLVMARLGAQVPRH